MFQGIDQDPVDLYGFDAVRGISDDFDDVLEGRKVVQVVRAGLGERNHAHPVGQWRVVLRLIPTFADPDAVDNLGKFG